MFPSSREQVVSSRRRRCRRRCRVVGRGRGKRGEGTKSGVIINSLLWLASSDLDWTANSNFPVTYSLELVSDRHELVHAHLRTSRSSSRAFMPVH